VYWYVTNREEPDVDAENFAQASDEAERAPDPADRSAEAE